MNLRDAEMRTRYEFHELFDERSKSRLAIRVLVPWFIKKLKFMKLNIFFRQKSMNYFPCNAIGAGAVLYAKVVLQVITLVPFRRLN